MTKDEYISTLEAVLWTLHEHAKLYMKIADNVEREVNEALAQPPAQEVGHSPTREYDTEDMGAAYAAEARSGESDDGQDDRIEAAYWQGRHDERAKVEGETSGDEALAAFDMIERWIEENSRLPARIGAFPRERKIVRQVLRQQSRVPDEIRAWPGKLRDDAKDPGPVSAFFEGDFKKIRRDERRRIANELERAIKRHGEG